MSHQKQLEEDNYGFVWKSNHEKKNKKANCILSDVAVSQEGLK